MGTLGPVPSHPKGIEVSLYRVMGLPQHVHRSHLWHSQHSSGVSTSQHTLHGMRYAQLNRLKCDTNTESNDAAIEVTGSEGRIGELQSYPQTDLTPFMYSWFHQIHSIMLALFIRVPPLMTQTRKRKSIADPGLPLLPGHNIPIVLQGFSVTCTIPAFVHKCKHYMTT